ncbi:1,4-alpha-glucan branching protein GlgB [Dongshaea marina]|uniref:1,4-alpha-glucan branching protein GlgB n=1 Tax=Dongshaea marina TaxID=2047966 RepID=UPI000D3ECF7B|nr:1,4-alpha-glucan branching protein GlgB [Dongshaea marina]
MLLQNLAHARCGNPFEHLGLKFNAQGTGLELTAWMPSAQAITVKDLKTGKALCEMTREDEKGLFTASFPRRQKLFSYFFTVQYDQAKVDVIDPYQFHDTAYAGLAELTHAPENIYHTLGAQLTEVEVDGKIVQGVRFAVYAPSATAVSVVGDFNYWDGTRQPMQRSLCGHWVLFVPGVGEGMRYKFELKDPMGNRLPHKTDPVGFQIEQFPSHSSTVYDHRRYEWNDQQWIESQRNNKLEQPMSIYELHMGSWRRHGDGSPLSYRELVNELIPYILEMGYTHIELLPVSEHPFSGSWGYQPVGMFASTTRFGNADDFKFFVDQCHQQGIGVIVDWVPAHFPSDEHGLARFDGTPLYEYEDPRRGWHPDWNSFIYDFGRNHVRQFLVASALYWLEYFHVDGIRVDAVASMLYLDYSRNEGEWVPNVDGGNLNYEAVSLIKWFNEEIYAKYPHAMTIAEESTAFPGVSKPTYAGGLGFGFKWNMGWMHDSLTYMSKDPCYRKYHHNEMTFAMIYNYDENFVLPLSHDEVVHGKGSLLDKMPGDEWQQVANLRAYTAFMFGFPGKKLNFMGHEIAQSAEWNHDDSLQWWLLEYDKHNGQQKLVKDLNRLYRQESALWEADYQHDAFSWLEHCDAESSIFAWIRRNKSGSESIVVLSHFTPVPRNNYRMGVPGPGRYKVLLNSDSHYYWGSNYETGAVEFEAEARPWHGQEYSIELNVPPLATLFIKRI